MPSISPPVTSQTTTPLSESQAGKTSAVNSTMAQQLTSISSDQSVSQSKSLKIEKQGMIYSPFTVQDSVMSCVGRNINRLLQGKALYPVIVRDDNAKMQFEQSKRQLHSDWQKVADYHNKQIEKLEVKHGDINNHLNKLKTLHQRYNDPTIHKLINEIEKSIQQKAIYTALCQVLNQLEIKSNKDDHSLEKLSTKHNKLYIIGHGLAGNAAIYSESDHEKRKYLSGFSLAQELANAGLSKNFSDFRTSACWSADSKPIYSFDKQELNEASQPIKIDKPWLFFWKTKTLERHAFAQELSDSLGVMGFYNAQVTGYHGAHNTIPNGLHQIQEVESQTTHTPIQARSSKVKHVFTPNLTWEIKLSNYMSYLKDSFINMFRSSEH